MLGISDSKVYTGHTQHREQNITVTKCIRHSKTLWSTVSYTLVNQLK